LVQYGKLIAAKQGRGKRKRGKEPLKEKNGPGGRVKTRQKTEGEKKMEHPEREKVKYIRGSGLKNKICKDGERESKPQAGGGNQNRASGNKVTVKRGNSRQGKEKQRREVKRHKQNLQRAEGP